MPVAVGVMADSYNKPAGGGFNPATLTNLAAWFDAADDAVFTYGTGTQVTGWVDKSPNAFTVTRAASVNLVRNDTINGVKCLTSLHATMNLTRTNVDVRALVDPTTFTDCMSFYVVSITTAATGGWFAATGGTYRVTFDLREGATSNFDVANFSGGRLGGTVGMVLNTPTLVAVYRNGANMKVFRNATEVLSKTNASGNIAASQLVTLTLLQAGNGIVGKVGEILHVARYNATDFTATTNYLKTKWGIP